MKAVLGLFVVLFCAGCPITQSHVSNNTDLTAVDFEELLNQKSGQSCNTVFFGIFPASGDYASVAKAAWGGFWLKLHASVKIKNIRHAWVA